MKSYSYNSFKLGLFLSLMLIFCFPSSVLAGERIVISGSTTVIPVIQAAGEAFMKKYPDVSLAISGGGTGSGLKALSENLCDIAMASRPIAEEERATALKNGVNPFATPIAIDALLIITHSKNPIKGLSLSNARDIYARRITNWKDLGGEDENIVLVSRDSSSGTYASWRELVMQGERIAPRSLLQTSCGGVAEVVRKNPKSIGYVGFGYFKAGLNAPDLDKVHPTVETALADQWPLARELYFYTNGEPKGAILSLINFILSPEGRQTILDSGFIPLPEKSHEPQGSYYLD